MGVVVPELVGLGSAMLCVQRGRGRNNNYQRTNNWEKMMAKSRRNPKVTPSLKSDVERG